MEVFLQALVNGILLGGFYSLMGMGQNIIFGVMNIVNFCHGEMLMVGMYITYVLYTYFGVDPYVALPIVAVLMFGLGALIQSTLITPSLKTKSFTNLLFLTVGLGLLLTNGALVIFGSTYYKIITRGTISHDNPAHGSRGGSISGSKCHNHRTDGSHPDRATS